MPLPSGDLLRGEKVRLSALTENDLPALARWYENGDFIRHFDMTPAVPRADWSGYLANRQERRKQNTDFSFAVRPLDDSRMVGLVGIDEVIWAHQVGFVGLAIGDPAERRKGYGRDAMQLITRFAFYELNLRRLALTVFSYNTPAIALYESLGWVREGVYREHLMRDGQPHDMLLYGLLAREWQGTSAR